MPNITWGSKWKSLKLENNIITKYQNNSSLNTHELINYYEKYINYNNLSIKEYHELLKISKYNDNMYKLEVKNNINNNIIYFYCKYVILNIGLYENYNKLNETIENNNNSIHYLNFENKINNKNICIVGSSYSAIDCVINYIENNKIIWIFRSEKFNTKYSKINILLKYLKMYSNNIKIYKKSNLTNYTNNVITINNNIVYKDIYKLFLLIGYHIDLNLLNNSNIKNDGKYPILNNYETNLKNVYISGNSGSVKNKIIYMSNGNDKNHSNIIINSILKKEKKI